MMNELTRMTRDCDAFVFYSALVIAVLTLFIGHDGVPDATASAASPAAQAVSARDAAVQQQGVRDGGLPPLVLAVSHKTY
ncbi:MAG: hypothetical protein KF834_09270 [Burkholderiales bacterium]|nr:hypothetical protein [Burkholderiales bacterium]